MGGRAWVEQRKDTTCVVGRVPCERDAGKKLLTAREEDRIFFFTVKCRGDKWLEVEEGEHKDSKCMERGGREIER